MTQIKDQLAQVSVQNACFQAKASFVGQIRRFRSLLLLLILPAFLAACSGTWKTDYGEPLDIAETQNWRVSKINVIMPASLTWSDINTYAPNYDVVWHGDPAGNRIEQVKKIVYDSARTATSGMRGSVPVIMNLTVQQFHGVTPISLAEAPAAVYNMQFEAQVVDARNGAALTPPTKIFADAPALVGEEGLRAIQFGPSQKEQVTTHLVAVFKGWLGIGPDVRGSFSSLGR